MIPIRGDSAGCLRLIVAVVAQAVRDVTLQDHVIRREAIQWLRSGEAAWLLHYAGKPIRQGDIDCWLDGFRPPRRLATSWRMGGSTMIQLELDVK